MITRNFTARRLGGLLRKYPQANTYKGSRFPVHAFQQYTSFSTTPINAMKILAVLYDGGEPAQRQPRLLGTTENKVCFIVSFIPVDMLIRRSLVLRVGSRN